MKIKGFKEWVSQPRVKKTKLAIFDYDKTLAHTPEAPQKGEQTHSWNGKDWWGSEESLSAPFYNGEMNEEVHQALVAAKSDPLTKTVILTGRRGVVAPFMRGWLQKHNLFGKRIIPDSNKSALGRHAGMEHENEARPDAHEEYYSGDHVYEDDYPTYGKKKDGSTLAHKTYVLRNKLMSPDIEQIDMWEDRADHVPVFIKILLNLKKEYPNLKQATLHRVYPGWIQHIPIKDGMVF